MAEMTREEKIARLQELQRINTEAAREEAGISGRWQRGVSGFKSTLGAAKEAAGDILGNEDLQREGERSRLLNAYKAEEAAPPGRSITEDPAGAIGDFAVESAPMFGAYGAGAAAGALAGSAVPVLGTGAGALVGLALVGMGVNLGTVKEIEEAIDPESESSVTTALAAAGATVFDVATGGEISAPAKEAMKDILKGSIKKQAAAHLAKETVKHTGIASALTAANVATTEVGATLSTGAAFDEDRLEAIVENTLVAGLITPFIAGPASVLGIHGASRSANRQMRENELGNIRIDPETGAVTIMEPNSLATKAPSTLKSFASSIGLGTAADDVVAKAAGNTVVRDFVSNLHTTFEERGFNIGKNTVNVESELIRGDIHEVAGMHDLRYMRRKDLDKLEADIRAGVKSEKADKVRSAFEMVKEKARAAGIVMGDLGPTYLPFHPDLKAIRKNTQQFIEDMTQATIKSTGKNYTEAQVEKIRNRIADYTQEILGDGEVRLADEATKSAKLVEALKEAEEGKFDKLRRPFVDISRPGRINQNNNLERHRFLSSVDSESLKKWERKDIDLVDRMEMYTKLAAERIAYAERFGADNEKLNEIARRAIVEGLDTGNRLTHEALESIFDLANLQQRITSKKVTPEHRRNTAAVKTAMNVLTLPLATVSSGMELLFLAPKTGMKPFITGGAKTMEAMGRKVARTSLKYLGADPSIIKRSQAEAQLSQMSTSMREAMVSTLARLGEDTVDPSRIDQWFFRANLLSQWTMFQRSWGQLAAIDAFKEQARIIQDSRFSMRERRNAVEKLTDVGLDPNEVMKWVNEGAREDVSFYRNIKAGAITLAEDVIFEPTPVNKPAWSSNPHAAFQFLAHLKTFPLQFNNRIVIPVARKFAQAQGIPLDKAIAMVTTMAFAHMGFTALDAAKTYIRDGDLERWEEKTTRQRLMTSLSQIGAFGMAVDMGRTGSYGGSAVESIVGPTYSKGFSAAGNTFGVLMGEVTPEEALKETLLGLPSFAGSRDYIRNEM